ncbi:MAG: hypothetical protein V7744_20700 [Pseudomonadales bacterium]
MNLAKVEKHYTNLTVDERARLMIEARMRDDDLEVKKLTTSAERKHFTIKANDESDIYEAWHKAHLIMISLNADSRIKELQCALTCWQIVSDEDNEFDEDSAEKVINLVSRYQQARKVALLAFTDWIEEHNLPFESELLEVCDVEICLLDSEEKDALKQHESYSAIVSMLTNLGIGKKV